MGTSFGSLIEAQSIRLDELQNKVVSVDAFNMLYQFLTTIRQYDGTPLMDAQGNITSHLSGLFFRMTQLLSLGMKPVFVFDGKAPDLKKEEQQARKVVKEEAKEKYKEAKAQDDIASMKKYASRTAYLTTEMIVEAKELLNALGIPTLQAPAEGEAQAAYLVKQGVVQGMISQDTDALMFGCPVIYRNISIQQRKKFRSTTKSVDPQKIELDQVLNQLGVDQDQLIALGILCGTDYNRGGIKGIGPAKGLKLVHEYKKDFDALFTHVEWHNFFSFSWQKVFQLFKEPKIEELTFTFGKVNPTKINEIMVGRHGFSAQRIENSVEKLTKTQAQTGLGDFF